MLGFWERVAACGMHLHLSLGAVLLFIAAAVQLRDISQNLASTITAAQVEANGADTADADPRVTAGPDARLLQGVPLTGLELPVRESAEGQALAQQGDKIKAHLQQLLQASSQDATANSICALDLPGVAAQKMALRYGASLAQYCETELAQQLDAAFTSVLKGNGQASQVQVRTVCADQPMQQPGGVQPAGVGPKLACLPRLLDNAHIQAWMQNAAPSSLLPGGSSDGLLAGLLEALGPLTNGPLLQVMNACKLSLIQDLCLHAQQSVASWMSSYRWQHSQDREEEEVGTAPTGARHKCWRDLWSRCRFVMLSAGPSRMHVVQA